MSGAQLPEVREDEVQTLRRLLGEARAHLEVLVTVADPCSNEEQRALVRARRWLEDVRR